MRLVPVVLAALVGGLAATSDVGAGVEAARPAVSFTDSVGINTHYNNAQWGDSPYGNRSIDRLLSDLGVRHIRDNTQTSVGFSAVSLLYQNYGIRTDLVLTAPAAPQDIVSAVKMFPAIESVEGINEPDGFPITFDGLSDDPSNNDFSATRAYQDALYAAMKAEPATAAVPVLSPAMMDPGKTPLLKGIGFDAASMHAYAAPHRPTYQLDGRIWQVNQISDTPVKIIATETGYYTRAPTGGQVSEKAQAKYVTRLFGEYFNRGISRTYDYELVDGRDDPADPEANFGLLRNDLSPKPAYTALKNLMQLLRDPSSTPILSTDSISFSLTGGGSSLQHSLLEKSDGSFYLLLWNDVASWDVTAQTDIINAAVPVTLQLDSKFDLAQVFIPGQSASALARYNSPRRLNLNVPDDVMVVELSRRLVTHVPEPAAVALFGAAIPLLCRRRG
jgi:hypothetical protein